MSHSQTSCCVPGCSAGQDVRLHHFPNPETDTERFRTWVMRVGGDIIGLENMFIFKNKRICTRHFEAVYQYARKLSKTAIPTLNLGSHFCRLQTQAEFPIVPVLQQDVAIPSNSQQKLYGVYKLYFYTELQYNPDHHVFSAIPNQQNVTVSHFLID